MLIDYFKPLVDWIYLHPHWGSFFAFFISFFESIAIIGAVVPGIVFLTAIGALVGSNILPASEVFLCAMIGAMLGDTLSFMIGYHFHEKVRVIWPFYRFPYLITKGEIFFKRHGGKSVFLGRFAGPVRVITPVVAGMLNMSPWRFLMTTTVASPLWAISYLLPGILIGAASQELAPETAKRFLLMVVLVLLVLWCISWLLKRIFMWILHCLNRLIMAIWQSIQSTTLLKPIHSILKYSEQDSNHIPLILFFSILISALAFLFVSYNVIHHSILLSFNQPALHLMLSVRNDNLDKLMIGLTYLGEFKVLAVVILALSIWLIWKQYYRAAFFWILNSLLAMWAISIIKPIVHSLRPQVTMINHSGWSYPSGHSTLSVAIFGFLGVLMAKDSQPNNRGLIIGFAGILSLIIMSTRLYLTAHWLTDIVGGTLLGLTCVLFTTLLYRPHLHVNPMPRQLFMVALIALLFSWTYYFVNNFQYDLYAFKPQQASITVSLDEKEWWQDRKHYPLLYRLNRFGKASEIINVEWEGDLSTIQQKLLDRGWMKKPKINLALILAGLTSNNRNLQPPLITQLYHNEKPSLVLTKFLAGENKQLVLRLWMSDINLTNSPYPLWVGTISYHRPWEPDFLNLQKAQVRNALPASMLAINALEIDISGFRWKEVPMNDPSHINKKIDPDWSGRVLLIES